VAGSAIIVRIMPKSSQPLVVILAYDGLCLFEFSCAVEIFGLSRPEMGSHWYRCAIAAAEPGPLRGIGGLRVQADGGLELLADAFMAVIPGWRAQGQETPPEPLLAALRQAHARGCRLVSICAGAFVLAAAGLLAGRRATTHWRHVETLANAHPDITVEPGVLYVDEGSVLTSAGSAAGLDLCLHLVRRDFGAKAANRVARRLVIAGHREGGQTQFIERPVPRRAGSRLAPLLDRVRSRLDERWPIERLAVEAGMSMRGIHRHIRDATGLAPGQWLLAERIARAREMLEESNASVEHVARHVGFGAAATLRNHFRKIVGVSPATYRTRFAAEVSAARR
jgi:AraC family transcriptional activator FtrA